MLGISMNATKPLLKCAACQAESPADALFCQRCTAPLAVAGLQEFDAEDFQLCQRALLEVLAETAGVTPAPTADEELWRAYLSAFWLRPETALILYAEALALRAIGTPDSVPWLDLGCGDGVHAALCAGWRFKADFDVFQSLDLASRDIYNAWDPTAFSCSTVTRGRRIEFGVDIKPTAVSRAAALGVFGRVFCGDATALDLEDGSVGVIYSNMLRDLGAPLGAALNQCRRVLRDDGVLLLSAMTPDYSRNLYFAPTARKAEASGRTKQAQRLLRLDRGRSVFCQRQLSVPQWQELLEGCGLTLEEARPIVGSRVIRFWDVGLRPFSLPLLRQRGLWLNAGILATVKDSLLGAMAQLLAPLAGGILDGEPCMHLLVVRKK